MTEEYVVLVDAQDRQIGLAEKMEAHVEGWLHRAFSVFILNRKGEMLIQKRHAAKYHSGGLWSNACCSHPRLGESVLDAAARRLEEEMGFRCALEQASSLVYKVQFEGGLYEHEYDHIITGIFDGDPVPDGQEVTDWRWISRGDLIKEVNEHPEHYTFWFRRVLQEDCHGVLAEQRRML